MTKEQQTRANEISQRLIHLSNEKGLWEQSIRLEGISLSKGGYGAAADILLIDFKLVKSLVMVNILTEELRLEIEYNLL